MIDELRSMAIFATVVETGSFSAAGRRLHLGTSVVSYHVSELEKRLGVTLLYRSTRALSMTHEGERLLEAAQRMISAAADGLDTIADLSAEPSGALHLTAPAFLQNSPYEAAIWSFAERYNNVAITLRSSDKVDDIIGEGWDLAIRIGRLKDSALKARRLGDFERRLVASPAYLASVETIKTPKDLQHRGFVSIEMVPDTETMSYKDKQQTVSYDQIRIRVDTVRAARSAVLAGLGLQSLPLSEIADDLQQGRLVHVLPNWSLEKLGVFAVWPETGPRSALTRRLLEHIKNSISADKASRSPL